jgi:two-component system response regulator AtoC
MAATLSTHGAVMERDPVCATEAEMAIADESQGRQAPAIRDGLPPVANDPFPTNPRARRMTPDENPVTRVQEELALWASPRMRDVRDIIMQAALINVTVLITGETGTGKELVARAMHYLSGRHHGPFLTVNCAAVAHDLLESELFGHEHGAFTDARQPKIGKFETAHRGTIFLDEIGDLHPALQAKLLHVLEDGQFSRVGGRSRLRVDVRVVAATNQDLEASVAVGRFREDLFYRLNVIRIVVPPLRNRVEEIPVLASYFVERYSRLFQREVLTLPPETLQQLQQHSFPGNVRELENMIKRLVVLRDLDLTRVPLIGVTASGGDQRPAKREKKEAGSLRAIARKAAQAAEEGAILKALEQTRWNRLRAAKLLNISYRSLLYKIKGAGLDGKRRIPDLP